MRPGISSIFAYIHVYVVKSLNIGSTNVLWNAKEVYVQLKDVVLLT